MVGKWLDMVENAGIFWFFQLSCRMYVKDFGILCRTPGKEPLWKWTSPACTFVFSQLINSNNEVKWTNFAWSLGNQIKHHSSCNTKNDQLKQYSQLGIPSWTVSTKSQIVVIFHESQIGQKGKHVKKKLLQKTTYTSTIITKIITVGCFIFLFKKNPIQTKTNPTPSRNFSQIHSSRGTGWIFRILEWISRWSSQCKGPLSSCR